MGVPDHLAAELHPPPVRQRDRLHPSADALAGLQDHHVGTAPGEVTRRRQSRQSGPQDDHVAHASPLSLSAPA